jgi:hypothetical protein
MVNVPLSVSSPIPPTGGSIRAGYGMGAHLWEAGMPAYQAFDLQIYA